jgi:methionyl-tRNA synthetase
MTRFVSTAIAYVNARPHLGHALEYVQADAYVRTQKLFGEDTFFLTGTDDNALKNVQAAEKEGKGVAEYVAENTEHFIRLDRRLAIGYDDFIRTSSDPRHRAGVEKLWRATNPADLYKKSYRGLYCLGCEEFKTEKDLVHGECPEHPGKRLEEVEEENYFFRLSAYEQRLRELIESDTLAVVPETRKNEVLSFIKGGLEDFSVSRSARRAKGWGIPVPDDPEQYLYVWYDALANYITGLGYATEAEPYQTYWVAGGEKVHMIGKGITRFHAVYWPAMLLSAGVPLPTKIFVHGYLTSGGQKMSKSLGNVIDPNELIDRYGADGVRYLLLRHVSSSEDSDLTHEAIHDHYTAHLANGLGNLVARVMKLAETHVDGPIVPPEKASFPGEYMNAINAFEFNKAMDMIWSRITALDARITNEKPFVLVKGEAEKGEAMIRELVLELYAIAEMLQPFLPTTSGAIKAAVLANKKPENLFPRIA